MAHQHPHRHHSTENLSFAFWLNTGFALLEIAGGLFTNSVAILSDALHDLGDSLSLGLAYYFHRKSHQKRDQTYSYGYRRFSLLGALINAIVLIVGSIFIWQEAIPRLFHPENEEPNAKGMLLMALAGILINGVAFLRLKKGNSMNEKVISLHFVEDILGWVAVLIGSIAMIFVNIPILDPILSLLISSYILFNVYNSLKESFQIILQGVPRDIPEEKVRQKIMKVDQIESVHDLHLWTMDGEYNVLTLHVVVNEKMTLSETDVLKQRVKQQLADLAIQHITIEIETPQTHCQLEKC